jgi:subtilisin family serine protease
MKSLVSIRRPVALALVSGALALTLSLGTAHAQESVPAADAEGGDLWFVELLGRPVADGAALATVRSEKAAFRRAAEAAGASYTEHRSFDVLFNGFTVEASAADRAKIARLPGVRAMYPVEIIAAPDPERSSPISADLTAAINLTGAASAQAAGYSGKGIKVGIVDTGIDIDHPAFGGNGAPGTTSFPSVRVGAGWDFVGDNYNSSGTPDQQVPVPDPNPDDCGGHGTHVAGIVGGSGGGIKGVAPGVTFGAYRVFGCTGTSSADVIVAALERAYADGMQVVNQSLGAARQWPQYPTAQASSRLAAKGVVMVASIGNNGPGGTSPDAQFAGGAPGVGDGVIAVASYDNAQRSFVVNGLPYGFNSASGSPAAPTSGSLPMSRTGTTTTANDACTALPAGGLTGTAALIRRGTCSFYIKAANAQAAGAAAVVLYNNAAGALNPSVAPPAGSPPITIPVVAITATQGATLDALIAGGTTTLNWTGDYVDWPYGTGGLISGFSSFGLNAELTLKPNIGAPGGGILSSYPLELGATAVLSGTSMSSPHVAGGVALILEADRFNNTPWNMQRRLQSTADPKYWSGNPALGLLDHAHRQGAGMLDIMGTIRSRTLVTPGQLSVGESESGPKTFNIKVDYEGKKKDIIYDITHEPAVAAGPNTQTGTSYNLSGVFDAPAAVTFSAPSITVPPLGRATFDVTIAANPALPDRSIYGGYIVLTPRDGGDQVRVPYAGFKGDYQVTQVLTPTANGFPWLAQLVGTSYLNRNATGATYTMVGDDIPYFLMHLDHHSRRIQLEVFDAVTGKAWNFASDDEYVTRNSTPGGFFAFEWDGTTFYRKGRSFETVPNGQYVVKVSVLKALGDASNPAHWETWTSSVITIARP